MFSKRFAQRNVFVPLISDEQLALADKDCNFDVHKRDGFASPDCKSVAECAFAPRSIA